MAVQRSLPVREDVRVSFDDNCVNDLAVPDQPIQNSRRCTNAARRKRRVEQRCAYPRFDNEWDLDNNGETGDPVNRTGQELCAWLGLVYPSSGDSRGALLTIKWVRSARHPTGHVF